MIRSLEIKDFILVEFLAVEFGKGLNILTGETGAGKSIIVNAFAQLCGERSSAELVRQGARKAVIEAQFERPVSREFRDLANELELNETDSALLIIRKEIGANGTTRNFVNDSPLTLNRLNRLSSFLLDLHGQHQHQRLLHPENHIIYLDKFAHLEEAVKQFNLLLQQYRREVRELDELKAKQLEAFRLKDMYRYQFDELSKADLDPRELTELKDELRILSNVESLHQSARSLADLLYSGEMNAGELLTRAETHLQELAALDKQFVPLSANLVSARETIEEIGRFAEEYTTQLQFNAQRMEFIHQRIAMLEFLLKKYQKISVAELIALKEEMSRVLKRTEHFDQEIRQKETLAGKRRNALVRQALDLSAGRNKAARSFERKITAILAEIGMNRARFSVGQSVRIKPDSEFIIEGRAVAPDERGFDQIVFEMASNGGEVQRPIHKIASGGEISRLMLALKSVLAEKDHIPTLVFDEIDAGISGKVAQIVGRKLYHLAKFHQILCVTHLPQIAAFAHSHYKVEKYTEDSRTFVDISLLNRQGQVEEIANLLGGQNVSSQALENARQLMDEAQSLQK